MEYNDRQPGGRRCIARYTCSYFQETLHSTDRAVLLQMTPNSNFQLPVTLQLFTLRLPVDARACKWCFSGAETGLKYIARQRTPATSRRTSPDSRPGSTSSTGRWRRIWESTCSRYFHWRLRETGRPAKTCRRLKWRKRWRGRCISGAPSGEYDNRQAVGDQREQTCAVACYGRRSPCYYQWQTTNRANRRGRFMQSAVFGHDVNVTLPGFLLALNAESSSVCATYPAAQHNGNGRVCCDKLVRQETGTIYIFGLGACKNH